MHFARRRILLNKFFAWPGFGFCPHKFSWGRCCRNSKTYWRKTRWLLTNLYRGSILLNIANLGTDNQSTLIFRSFSYFAWGLYYWEHCQGKWVIHWKHFRAAHALSDFFHDMCILSICLIVFKATICVKTSIWREEHRFVGFQNFEASRDSLENWMGGDLTENLHFESGTYVHVVANKLSQEMMVHWIFSALRVPFFQEMIKKNEWGLSFH